MNFSTTEIFKTVLYYVCILHYIFPSLSPDKISNIYIRNPNHYTPATLQDYHAEQGNSQSY